MWRAVRLLFLVALLSAGAYVYRDQVRTFALQAYREVAPCTVPISYTIRSIDPRFGIATSTLERSLEDSARIWNEAAGKTLFIYDQDRGELSIDLVYDIRQETTEKLTDIGESVDEKLAAYDAAKTRYAAEHADYERDKAAFEAGLAAYERDAAAYESEVRRWNARGGAPRSVYQDLENKKAALEREESRLRSLQARVNAEASSVNELARSLNGLAQELNISVASYNTVGRAVADEFEEAVYESRPGAQTISVYEFESTFALTRVLAHEFGHALGIDHVDEENAIMYRINQGSSIALAPADTAALKAQCGL